MEKKDGKGHGSGVFKMDKAHTKSVARDVAIKQKKLSGKELDNFVEQYFTRTWDHFDVNNEGMLDTLDMTAFMKYFVSDQGMDLDGMFA